MIIHTFMCTRSQGARDLPNEHQRPRIFARLEVPDPDAVSDRRMCEPDVLDLIQRVVAAGHDERVWVGVCGEAASDPTVAAALVGLDVDELSRTRVAIPEVKDVLRRLSSEDCRTAVMTAIEQAEDGAQARRIIEGSLQLTNVVAGDVHRPVG